MSAVNDTAETEVDDLAEGAAWTLVVAGVVTWAVGVFGNILVLCTLGTQPLVRSRNPASTHNIFIGNLALADLFIVGYGLPFWVWDVATGEHPTVNSLHCALNGYMGFVSSVTSTLTLWTISFNRYMSICHHATYRKFMLTRKAALWFCVGLWVGPALLSSLPFFGPGSYGYDRKTRACFLDRLDSTSHSYIFVTVPVVIVLISIGYFNGAIFRHWHQHKKRMGRWQQQSAGAAQKSNKSHSQSAQRAKVLPHDRSHTSSACRKAEKKEEDLDNISSRFSSSEGAHMTPVSNAHLESSGTTVAQTRSKPINILSGEIHALQDEGAHAFVNSDNSQVKVNDEDQTSITETVLAARDTSQRTAPLTLQTVENKKGGKKGDSPSASASSNRALVRSLFAVYVCLVILFSAVVFVGLLEVLVNVPSEVTVSGHICFFLNSSINWILYGVFNQSFRMAYRHMFSSCRRGVRVGAFHIPSAGR